jgi:formylglycine-generating enzyme required for sulfatase activity
MSIPTEIPTLAPALTPTSTLGIGSSMISEKDGATLVYVPAGEFMMGSDSGDADELPVHNVYLDAFWIDQTEVTNKQYEACVADGSCRMLGNYGYYADYILRIPGAHPYNSYYGNPEFDEFPVILVNWRQAKLYCLWVGRQLPSEAQWEKAARGADALTYPWGNEAPNIDLLNYNLNFGNTSKVGSYEMDKSIYGAYDMAGNVMEWVSSLYKPYPYDANDGREDMDSHDARVLRGGWWADEKDDAVRSANRSTAMASYYRIEHGFRCALPVP